MIVSDFRKKPRNWESKKRDILARKKEAAAKELRSTITHAFDLVKARSLVPYDGVLGTPPEWVRDPFRRQFEWERARLLHEYSPEKILEFMEAQREASQPGVKSVKHTPRKIRASIDFLYRIQRAVEAGEEKGLIMFAGEDAERGAKVLKGVLHAHETKHGTAEEKAERWQHFKDECLKVHDENPRWGLTKIRQEVADRADCSLKNIERHTKNLRNLIDRLS